jgi:hypothetical protein
MTNDSTMSPPIMTDGPGNESTVKKRSSWPTVLGIIGIILASLGILSSTCSFFLPAIMESVVEQMGPEEKAELMGSLPSGAFLYVSLVISLVLAIVLLWGAIQLLKRRQAARGLLNMYAVASIIWFLCGFVWQATIVHPEMKAKQAELMQQAEQANAKDNGKAADTDGDAAAAAPSDSPMGDPMSDANFYASQACGGVFTIGWSVLLLVFMNGGRYRDEMESWVD